MLKSLRQYIKTVYERDPAARSLWEILTLYPGVRALFFHRVAHRLWRWRMKWLARLVSGLSRWMTGIEIHPGARIGKRFFIDHGMGVVVGETAEIGDDCTLYQGVTLGGTTWDRIKRHPTLGNNVVIGAGAKVLGPIKIGDNARIGSNSVVVKDVPADSTAVGIPAHVVPEATSEQTQRRKAMAKKIGFAAYGQTQQMPDPVAHAIDHMLDHMHLIDQELKTLSDALKKTGVKVKLDIRELSMHNLDEEPSPPPTENTTPPK